MLGFHQPRPYRNLTQHSCEFRCIRCEKSWADVQEDWLPPMLRGARPYGTGQNDLGELLAWRGANERADMVNQTPFWTWFAERKAYLARSDGGRLRRIGPQLVSTHA
jgi:hypothetical protein